MRGLASNHESALWNFLEALQKTSNMSNASYHTYKATRNVTKSDLILACTILGGFPEAMSDGGIRFLPHYGTNLSVGQPYKSMRLGFGCVGAPRKWPFIKGDEMTSWVNSLDVLIHTGETISTTLKSFEGAPEFTKDEMVHVSHALGIIWLVVFKKSKI